MLQMTRRYGQIGMAFGVLALLCMVLSGIVRSSIYALHFFRGDVSNNAIAIRIDHAEKDMEPFLQHLLTDDNVSAIHKLFPFADVEAVWIKQLAEKDYPLISGRYFTKSDLMSKERLAVVGQARFERESEKEGISTTVYFDSQPFQVIGVIGDPNKETYLDDVLYVNLFSLTEKKNISPDGEYIVDFYNQSSSSGFIDRLKNYFNDAHVLLEQIPISNYRIDVASVLKDDDFVRLLMTTVIMIVFSSFCMALSWIQKRSSEIQIRKQVGASNVKIIAYLYSRFTIVSIIAFLIALLLYISFHNTLMERLNYAHATFDIKLASVFYLLCNLAAFAGILPCMYALRSISPARKEFKL